LAKILGLITEDLAAHGIYGIIAVYTWKITGILYSGS
jgi:hypothetical protein